jgi:hypothetical protein
MNMFGWTLVRTKEYEELSELAIRANSLHRWFYGWRDLEVIWSFLFKPDVKYSGWCISQARRDYAEARGTNEYGDSKGESGK